MIEINKIYLGDCIDVMKNIDDKSVDLIFADLPFNLTKNKWDQQIIPLDLLWNEYKRIIKLNGAIVLFAQGLFAAKLIMSNEKWFKYDLIWKKGERVSGFLNAKKQFLRNHEQLLVFYNKQVTYNPQFTYGKPLHGKGKKYLSKEGVNNNYGYYDTTLPENRKGSTQKYPKSVLNFEKPHPSIHPTEKSIKLCEYIILTFTDENQLVLDNTCGVGTICIAAKNLNRNFIGIEIDEKWVNIAMDRLK
jgi:DNA modification methylase